MMNNRFTLAAGALATLLASTIGLVVIPNWQFRDLQPVKDDDGYEHPFAPYGAQVKGRKVYADLGCIYCHSQQVRAASFGADIDRGWGARRSVARDYVYDNPPFMGTMRTGPDLENIGARQPSRTWQALHLYDPRLVSPGSIMPPHRFLFERYDVNGPVPKNAVMLPVGASPRAAYIVPSERAENLIEYLRSLDHSYELPEAK